MTIKSGCLGVIVLVLLGYLSGVNGGTTGEERTALTMTAENEIKIFVHGIYSGKMAIGIRSLIDGDATSLMDLAGISGENRTIFTNEIKKLCTEVRCGDGLILKDDLYPFSRLAERSSVLLLLLQESNVINATVTLNDLEPQSVGLISFSITTEEGKVSAVFPVESDYNLNLKFSSTQTPSRVSFFFTGEQSERKVLFSFTSLSGWDVSVKEGLSAANIREDYPSSGYTTVDGRIISLARPVTIITQPRQVNLVCLSVVAISIILSGVGMYIALRHIKKQKKTVPHTEEKEPSIIKKDADPRSYEHERLKELLSQGIITKDEYEQKLAELNAKN